MLQYLIAAIAVPLIFSVFALTMNRLPRPVTKMIAFFPAFFALVVGIYYWRFVAEGNIYILSLEWLPESGIDANLRLDQLSCAFVFLIGAIGVGIVQYSFYYFSRASPYYWFLLLGFMGAMTGLVLSDSLILMFIFWEATTLFSSLLIGMDRQNDAARYGALQAFLTTGFGGLCLLAGILLLGQIAGSYNISEIVRVRAGITEDPGHIAALILMSIGAFAKSAQFPLHFWLTGSTAAAAPVSAYLHSATMVNAGVFLLGRLVPVFGDSWLWQPMLTSVGLVTFVFASWKAFRVSDLKEILAYTTVAYLGVLTSLYGYARAGDETVEVLHFANHAFYKSALFLLVGWFEKIAGTRNIGLLDEQRWLPRAPVGAFLFLLGSLAMAGGPFLLSSFSKKVFLEEVLMGSEGSLFEPGAALLGSLMTVAVAMKLSISTFWGSKVPERPTQTSYWLLIVPSVLLLPQVVGGFYPEWEGLDLRAKSWPGGVTYWQNIAITFWLKLSIFVSGFIMFLFWRPIATFMRWPQSEHLATHFARQFLAASSFLRNQMLAGGHPRYFVTVLISASIVLIWVIYNRSSPGSITFQTSPTDVIGVFPAIFLAAATISLFFARSVILLIINSSIIGFTITITYILFRAPDLAITQILVETVSIFILLMAVRKLPRIAQEDRSVAKRVLHLSTAALFGFVVACVAAISAHERATSSQKFAGDIYRDLSLPAGAGRNVVNVILVDFRAADTMGEVIVLVTSALGAWMLLKGRHLSQETPEESK